jgi:hypothetical protein
MNATRGDAIAGWLRHARRQRRKEAATTGGVWRFVRDACFWTAAAGAAVGILAFAQWLYRSQMPFRTEIGEPGTWIEGAALVAMVFGFGVLMAWCGKRMRDADRERARLRDARRQAGIE